MGTAIRQVLDNAAYFHFLLTKSLHHCSLTQLLDLPSNSNFSFLNLKDFVPHGRDKASWLPNLSPLSLESQLNYVFQAFWKIIIAIRPSAGQLHGDVSDGCPHMAYPSLPRAISSLLPTLYWRQGRQSWGCLGPWTTMRKAMHCFEFPRNQEHLFGTSYWQEIRFGWLCFQDLRFTF